MSLCCFRTSKKQKEIEKEEEEWAEQLKKPGVPMEEIIRGSETHQMINFDRESKNKQPSKEKEEEVILRNVSHDRIRHPSVVFVPGQKAKKTVSKVVFHAPTPVIYDFEKEKERCFLEGVLFEDEQFPCHEHSLYYSHNPLPEITWLRPHQIVENPEFLINGHRRFNVQQGRLGNLWLIAGIASLTNNDELFYRVVAPNQTFSGTYAGIFHFQFWQYGEWVDVVVDDRLPTIHNKELIFMRSENPNEFWPALLEKAYAKLHGSYEALENGKSYEALEDLTGGLAEVVDLTDPLADAKGILIDGMKKGSLFSCHLVGQAVGRIDSKMVLGLVSGHAYNITDYMEVNGIVLLRLRNPWIDVEWRGPWSNCSSEWDKLPAVYRRAMMVNFHDEGEFWMSLRDLCRHFEKMTVLHPDRKIIDELANIKEKIHDGPVWESRAHVGAWTRGKTAGGGSRYMDTFISNPQFHFTLTEEDADVNDGKHTVVISVTQKGRRAMKHLQKNNHQIGFELYKADTCSRLTRSYFEYNDAVAVSDYEIMRGVCRRYRLPTGEYVVIPACASPNMEAEFMLRLFTNSYVQSEELL